MVTRMKENTIYENVEELEIPDNCDTSMIKDEIISLETKDTQGIVQQLKLRRVAYWDAKRKKCTYSFPTN